MKATAYQILNDKALAANRFEYVARNAVEFSRTEKPAGYQVKRTGNTYAILFGGLVAYPALTAQAVVDQMERLPLRSMMMRIEDFRFELIG